MGRGSGQADPRGVRPYGDGTGPDGPETIADEREAQGAYRFHAFPGLASPRPDVVKAARLWLDDQVNEQLWRQASPQPRAERASSEALVLVARSLLGAISVSFAWEMAGRSAPGTPCANPRCDRTIDVGWGRKYWDDPCRDQARHYRNKAATSPRSAVPTVARP